MKNIFRFLFVVFCVVSSTNLLYAQWTQINEPTCGNVYTLAASNSNLFIGSDSGIYRSSDGIKWNRIFSVPNASAGWAPYSVSALDSIIFTWVGGGEFYISTDNGLSWDFIENGDLDNVAGYGTTVAIAPGTNPFMKEYCLVGFIYGGFVEYYINQKTWNYSNWNSSNFQPGDIYAFAVDNTNLFALTNLNIYLSTDAGANWTSIASGPTTNSNTAIAVSGTNLFVGATGSGGIFLLTTNSTNWLAVDSGLTNKNICVLTIKNDTLYTLINDSTHHDSTGYHIYTGIWKKSLSEMITAIRDNENSLSTRFFLSQNYPNPFNPSTTIKYQIPKNAHVVIKLYDVVGRELRTLVNQEQRAGYYKYTLDASRLPSGVYFYGLQAGSYSETKKLLLLK